jgi:protein-disulfide isomerase
MNSGRLVWLVAVLTITCVLISWESISTARADVAAGTEIGAAGGKSRSQSAELDQLSDINAQIRELRAGLDALNHRVERIEALIPRQPPAQADVDLKGAPRLGSAAAKLGIVEFSDYQCPFCRRFHVEVFPSLKKDYIDTGKVAFFSRDFPLDFHPQATPAALAMGCINRQSADAFWEAQREVFAHQNLLGPDYFSKLIGTLGLDAAAFARCMTGDAEQKRIAAELRDADALGVDGTPTFFIGRVDGGHLIDATRLVGAQPYPQFAKVIDALLAGD